MPLYLAIAGFIAFEVLAWMPQSEASDKVVFLAALAAGAFLSGLWNVQIDCHLPKRLCSFVGRLSYPIFLLHWPIAALVWNVTGIVFGWRLLVAGGGVTVLVAALVVLLFEMPIERLRAAIRAKRAPLVCAPPEIADSVPSLPQLEIGAQMP
jgi:peptidoglycan/LPS O-acetylase OafA/YrhL